MNKKKSAGVFLLLFFTLFIFGSKLTNAQEGIPQEGEDSSNALTKIIKCLLFAECVDFNSNSGGNNSSPQPPQPEPSTFPIEPTTPAGTSCPVPSGKVICGSIKNPINGCGHCDGGYSDTDLKAYCFAACPNCGTESGIDIAGTVSGSIYLPRVGTTEVQWVYAGQRENKKTAAAIQFYSGTTANGTKYWLQFHHTAPGSGKSGRSGQIGAQICSACFRTDQASHVHVQLASGATKPSGNWWLDASIAFCR